MLSDETPLADVWKHQLIPGSVRVMNCLLELPIWGATTVGDVRKMSDEEILRTPNFGNKSLLELRTLIGYAGGAPPKPPRKSAPKGWRFFMNGACVFVGHEE